MTAGDGTAPKTPPVRLCRVVNALSNAKSVDADVTRRGKFRARTRSLSNSTFNTSTLTVTYIIRVT